MSATRNSLIISLLLHIAVVVPLVMAMPSFDHEDTSADINQQIKVTLTRSPLSDPAEVVEQPKQVSMVEEKVPNEKPIKKKRVMVVVSAEPKITPFPLSEEPPIITQQITPEQRQEPIVEKVVEEELGQHKLVTEPAIRVEQVVEEIRLVQININNRTEAAEKKRYIDLKLSYRVRLLAAIAKQKRYPKRAQKLGLEGEAVVGFIVNADGLISDIALVESSGYKHLNRAAIKVIEKVGQLEPIPPLLGMNSWKFQVPLQYSLN
jgi:protein TonB